MLGSLISHLFSNSFTKKPKQTVSRPNPAGNDTPVNILLLFNRKPMKRAICYVGEKLKIRANDSLLFILYKLIMSSDSKRPNTVVFLNTPLSPLIILTSILWQRGIWTAEKSLSCRWTSVLVFWEWTSQPPVKWAVSWCPSGDSLHPSTFKNNVISHPSHSSTSSIFFSIKAKVSKATSGSLNGSTYALKSPRVILNNDWSILSLSKKIGVISFAFPFSPEVGKKKNQKYDLFANK